MPLKRLVYKFIARNIILIFEQETTHSQPYNIRALTFLWDTALGLNAILNLISTGLLMTHKANNAKNFLRQFLFYLTFTNISIWL